jgi:transketolase
MGDEEGGAAKEVLGWEHPPFHVPEDVREAFRGAGRRGTEAHRAWSEQLARRLEANPALAERYRAHHRAPDGWTDAELASMVAQVGGNKDATWSEALRISRARTRARSRTAPSSGLANSKVGTSTLAFENTPWAPW